MQRSRTQNNNNNNNSNNQQQQPPVLTMNKPLSIILDIEGTISDIKFVSHILLPFTRNNIRNYFDDHFDRDECQEMIDRLRQTRRYYPDYPQILPLSAGKSLVVKTVSEYALTHIVNRNRMCGHVYDEVTTVLHNWKHSQQIKIYVFSSAMVSAQQLLLCCTNHGNCLPVNQSLFWSRDYALITDFFDSSIGDKCNPQSYWNISQIIGESPGKILFITDNNKEAKAALSANYCVCLIKRTDGGCSYKKTSPTTSSTTTIQYTDDGIPIINTLEDIKFY